MTTVCDNPDCAHFQPFDLMEVWAEAKRRNAERYKFREGFQDRRDEEGL